MESIQSVRQALSARSTTASIDELRERGRSRVKVIRAEHIAALVEEAVQRSVVESGLISRDEADSLIERSREEFSGLVAERQREAAELQHAREELGRLKAELADARRERDAAVAVAERHDHVVESLQEELEQERDRAEELVQVRSELEERVAELEKSGGGEMAPATLAMLQELVQLKSDVASRAAAAQPTEGGPSPAPGGGDLAAQMSAALEGLSKSMDERLDKIGRKMGISSAIEAGQVNLEGLFKDMDDAGPVESNLDTMDVKAKQSGGIGANLARLRKLKGGGDAE